MDNEFMDRLRKAMEEREVSASELSRLSGVGKSDISYYLKGRYTPKQDKCYLLANALNVDPGWLMTGVEPQSESGEDIVIEHPKNDDVRLLLQEMNRMTPEQIEQVKGMFRIMFKLSEKGMKEDDA